MKTRTCVVLVSVLLLPGGGAGAAFTGHYAIPVSTQACYGVVQVGNWRLSAPSDVEGGCVLLTRAPTSPAAEAEAFDLSANGEGPSEFSIPYQPRGQDCRPLWLSFTWSAELGAGDYVAYTDARGPHILAAGVGTHGGSEIADLGLPPNRLSFLASNTTWNTTLRLAVYGGRFLGCDSRPEITVLPTTGITASTATLNGMVTPDANGIYTWGWFEVDGLTNTLGDFILSAWEPSTTVSASVNGLVPGTPYYFRVVAMSDSDPGNVSYRESQFTTARQPAITGCRQSGNRVEVDYVGTPGTPYTVWASGDLKGWESLGAGAVVSPGLFRISDLSVSNLPARFYRVTSP